jgi:hypothetical protein
MSSEVVYEPQDTRQAQELGAYLATAQLLSVEDIKAVLLARLLHTSTRLDAVLVDLQRFPDESISDHEAIALGRAIHAQAHKALSDLVSMRLAVRTT